MGLFRRKNEIISPTQAPHVAMLNGSPAVSSPTASPQSSTANLGRPARGKGAGTSEVAADFRLVVDDTFTITGRGTVAAGSVGTGWVRVRGQVEVVRGGNVTGTYRIEGIERDRHLVELAQVGDDVGLLLKRADPSDVQRGDVLRAPGA